ncbi:TIGR03546 family protein [Litoribrevibacter albus]|uniref:DUF2062 domain-containing protein n=1 Tax=Litoribrevibacter albus TaxID=1473156 RepID=A0AA37SAU5_9GAMM|nr:TIGR03546 family protein [Litoribrevibacter albus]GLQ31219.1 hypothetical protein GCM10007876_16980 [Litoribrevibacter albus]
MLTIFAKLLKLLNSDQNPNHLALAVCFGLAVGLMPGFSAFLLIIVVLICVLKANLTLFFLVWGLFEGIAYVFDPVLHQLGYLLLTSDSLHSLWTGLIQSSFWKLTAFNNSLVMGALVSILVLWVPVYLLSLWIVKSYRTRIQAFIEKWKVTQFLKGSKFYRVYQSLAGE